MGHVVSSSEVSGKIATSAHHGNQLGSFSLLKTRPALAFSHIPDADDSPPHSFHGRQRSQNLAAGPWQRLESLAGPGDASPALITALSCRPPSRSTGRQQHRNRRAGKVRHDLS
jgi:hypothetical protein